MTMTVTDHVVAAQRGDHDSWEWLYRRYYYDMKSVARSVLKNEHAAEDAVQDGFTAIYERLHKLRCPDAFFSWMKTTVLRKATDTLTRRTRRQPLLSPPDVMAETIPHLVASAHDALVGNLEREELHSVIATMSEIQQQAINDYYFSDLGDVNDIAAYRGIPVGTVKRRMFSARNKLRELLEEAAA